MCSLPMHLLSSEDGFGCQKVLENPESFSIELHASPNKFLVPAVQAAL